MKKIIATVLAMVMALALCTTAFAATAVKYTACYDADGNELSNDGNNYWTLEKVAASYKGDAKDGNHVAYYDVILYTEDGTKVQGYHAIADASDYDYKFTATGKATVYTKVLATAFDGVTDEGGDLVWNDSWKSCVSYRAKAVEYTNVGEDCSQLIGDEDSTYYVVTYTKNKETVTEYYVEAEDGGTNLLVDGELVATNAINADFVAHAWVATAFDAKDNATEYTCDVCGVVATVYKTKDAAKAAGTTHYAKYAEDGVWLAWNEGTTATDTTDTTTTSPKTFDAGIAMYVGMALTSVAGSAVVIGKKKEF